MIIENNIGLDPIDFNENTSADRIGARIRNIRTAKGLSQAELGQLVGLTADRIQKYENGARKPKADLLKQIANALGVSTLSLTDPITTNWLGAMYALFELENLFDIKIEKAPDNHIPGYYLFVDFRNDMNDYMAEWYKVYTQMSSELKMATSDTERKEIISSYNNWKWTFPQGIKDSVGKDLQKARLKKKIEELQEVYDQL